MREILFRGKPKNLKKYKWVQRQLLHHRETLSVIYSEEADHPVGVMPETVGQFTGKTDKNRKKVFEHDILQTFTVLADGTVEKGGVGVIQWSKSDQCYVLATKEGYHIDDFGNLGRPEYYEVIGNIHDNPELLEDAE